MEKLLPIRSTKSFSPVTWMIRSDEERATEVNGGTKSDNGWELE